MEKITVAEVNFLDYALEQVIEKNREIGKVTGDFSRADALEDLAFEEDYNEIYTAIRDEIGSCVVLTEEERALLQELDRKVLVHH